MKKNSYILATRTRHQWNGFAKDSRTKTDWSRTEQFWKSQDRPGPGPRNFETSWPGQVEDNFEILAPIWSVDPCELLNAWKNWTKSLWKKSEFENCILRSIMKTLVAWLSIISNRKRVKIRFVRCPLSCHPLFQTLNWMTEPVCYFKPVLTSLNAF